MKEHKITTVDELVQALKDTARPDDYAGVLQRLRLEEEELLPYYRWNSRHYTRTCIHRNGNFELLVICYEPGQCTSIHDYDSQTAWIHPVMGEVVEERFALVPGGGIKLSGELHLHPGADDSLTNGSAIHRFTNRGPDRAVTLNLYARPMRKWRVYDEHTGGTTITPAGPPR